MNKCWRIILRVIEIGALILLVLPFMKPMNLSESPSRGKPVLVDEEHEYWTWIDDFCVRDNYLYLYSGSGLCGILKIYDIQGRFQRTYVINLRAEPSLHITERSVVIGNQSAGGYYEFAEGKYLQFCEVHRQEDDDKIRETFLIKTEGKKAESWFYEIHGLSMIRRNAEGKVETLLRRPVYYALVISSWVWPIYAIIALTCMFILRRTRPKNEGISETDE